MSGEITCPKCGAESGNDWSECDNRCPMPGSPHYDASMTDPTPTAPAPVEAMTEAEIALAAKNLNVNGGPALSRLLDIAADHALLCDRNAELSAEIERVTRERDEACEAALGRAPEGWWGKFAAFLAKRRRAAEARVSELEAEIGRKDQVVNRLEGAYRHAQQCWHTAMRSTDPNDCAEREVQAAKTGHGPFAAALAPREEEKSR
jgi:hypothetical protein